MRTIGRGFVLPMLLLGSLMASGGCGSDGRKAVSGTVTFQGKPLENGIISFVTTAEPPGPAGGSLIENGKYQLPADKGLEPGKYKVIISAAGPPAKQTPAEIQAKASIRSSELLPGKYNTATTLTAEVTAGGSNQFDFNLE